MADADELVVANEELVDVSVGERLRVLLLVPEPVLDGLELLLVVAELLGLVVTVCEDVGLNDDDEDADDVAAAVAEEVELAEVLVVPELEVVEEPLGVVEGVVVPEDVAEPLAVAEGLTERV